MGGLVHIWIVVGFLLVGAGLFISLRVNHGGPLMVGVTLALTWPQLLALAVVFSPFWAAAVYFNTRRTPTPPARGDGDE